MEFPKATLESMRSKALIAILFCLFVLAPQAVPAAGLSLQPSRAERAQSAPEITYKVSMSMPSSHLIEVEMNVKWANMPAQTEIKMPVWTPGSYLIREYSRQVQDFAASGANGGKLGWRKINKNTWQIDTGSAKAFTVRYKVYANDLSVRTPELNDEHLFLPPAAVFMYPAGQLAAPSTVEVSPFGNWKVATGLPAVSGKKNTFRASSFDILFDSPFEVSDFAEKEFTVKGKLHRYIVTGKGNYDLDRMAADTAKIVEQAYDIFGELPYDNYTFLLNLRGGGGLEHLNSTALQFPAFAFDSEQGYSRFLSLVAHEYFHCFNVKRIRPDALGPFDYENENYTKLLWVAEGGTSYFDGLLRLRAGLQNDRELLSSEASIIEQLYLTPGRFQTSLEEASFDAWIKYYRTDENAVNNQISYYDKGELVNFLLDISIRADSNGQKSLDDVMRFLYNEFYKKGKNYTPADYQRICEMMAGKSLDWFFAEYVRGRSEIDYDSILNRIGLQLVATKPENDTGYVGANLDFGDTITVRAVPEGTPAWNAGLNSGDEIVAADGYKASRQLLDGIRARKKAGDTLTLTVFRRGKLREINVVLGRTPASGYTIKPVANPTQEQKDLYKGLFLAELK